MAVCNRILVLDKERSTWRHFMAVCNRILILDKERSTWRHFLWRFVVRFLSSKQPFSLLFMRTPKAKLLPKTTPTYR